MFVSIASLANAATLVAKVEPPNWWPDHTLNPVRVLIRGSGLSGATVQARAGIDAQNVFVNANGTYLLVDLRIAPGLMPGEYPLHIRTPQGTADAPFRLEKPLAPQGRFQGFSPDDVIYLIMMDRFADGDPANNDPAISRGMFDRADPHRYHGGDLQGIIDHLPYLKSLGITAIWITPVYDNVNHLNEKQAVNGQGIADYHGYGTVDYYGVEEHFGDLALLRKLIDAAHALGLKVIQDQVANHVGPEHPWVEDEPKITWFHGTPGSHINETWQIWSLPNPHASESIKRDVVNGWFANVLPDLNQEDPDVARYEIQNALWWLGEAGFDGIRQDTLPYVSRAFWHDWASALKRQYPSARAVGEVFDPDPAVPSFFQGDIDSVFDFPLYFALRDVFAHNAAMERISRIFAQDRLYANPNMLVTFLGNHDVVRFLSEPGANAQQLKLAFTLLFTARGIPSIYYGDEIGMTGGADPDNRHDFPGGWSGDSHNAFEVSGRTADENHIWNYVHQLLALRAGFEPLRRGTMAELALGRDTWVYARQAGKQAAIVALNNGSSAADIAVAFSMDGTYRDALANTPALAIQSGAGTIHLAPHSAAIYENEP